MSCFCISFTFTLSFPFLYFIKNATNFKNSKYVVFFAYEMHYFFHAYYEVQSPIYREGMQPLLSNNNVLEPSLRLCASSAYFTFLLEFKQPYNSKLLKGNNLYNVFLKG